MEVYVKRENWEGGIWFSLPATEEAKEQLLQELSGYDPSVMIPFAAGVDCGNRGLSLQISKCLEGETLFSQNHFTLWNELAEKIDKLDDNQKVTLKAALLIEKPDSIGSVMVTLGNRGKYTLQPEIMTYVDLGRYVSDQIGLVIPEEIQDYIDYATMGSIWEGTYGCLLEEGFVEKKKEQEKLTARDWDIIDDASSVFEITLYMDGSVKFLKLPLDDEQIKVLQLQSGNLCIEEITEMMVYDKVLGLKDCLPPGINLGELNLVAVEVQSLIRKGEVNRRLLLGALEAEAPGTIEKVCEIIRNYADYEILPPYSLKPDKYAKYILQKNKINLAENVKPYFLFDKFGEAMLKKDTPVDTNYGIIRNKERAIPVMTAEQETIRWYSPVTISCYNGKDGTFPEVLQGKEAVSLKERIHDKMNRMLENSGERGLADLISNELLGRKIISMQPDVTEYAQDLYCVLEVKTRGKLSDREYNALMEEWKTLMALGWGLQLFNSSIDYQGNEAFIGLWDEENGKDLFVKPEEELTGMDPPYKMIM